jgi:hypothetical protein
MVSWWEDVDRLLTFPVFAEARRHDIKRHAIEGSHDPTAGAPLASFEEWVTRKSDMGRVELGM